MNKTATNSNISGELIDRVCEFISANATETLSLQELADRFALSVSHLQRTFKAHTGMSPREYQESCRLRVLKEKLRTEDSVTAALYGAGYGSSSRLYETANSRLGMTPATYKKNGRGAKIYFECRQTPIGPVVIAGTMRGLCFLQFGDSFDELVQELKREYPEATFIEAAGQFEPELSGLDKFLSGAIDEYHPTTDVPMSDFQQRVWQYLRTIPAGETRTYSGIAKALGEPNAARAVARACASNRIAVAIPCHRVVREGGDLGGYRWGLERKQYLLDLEKRP